MSLLSGKKKTNVTEKAVPPVQVQWQDGRSDPAGGCASMIYDPSTGAILTRTPSNWAKILLFFFVFYSVLALFAAGMLNIYFYGFVDEDTPVLHGNYSVMPQNPGMGFRPIPDWDRSIIHYRKSDKESYQKYVQALQDFLQPNNSDKAFDYRHGQDEFVDCTQNSTESEVDSLPCRFVVDDYMNVTALIEDDFGYPHSPTVVVKMNKVWDFVPRLAANETYLKIACEGLFPADKDNLKAVEYQPKPGFDLHYFPFRGQKKYVSPLVFVKFPNLIENVVLQVICKPVNAVNIKQEKLKRGDGRVDFQLMVEG